MSAATTIPHKPARVPIRAREYGRDRDRRERAKRSAEGFCIRCGKAPAAPPKIQLDDLIPARIEPPAQGTVDQLLRAGEDVEPLAG